MLDILIIIKHHFSKYESGSIGKLSFSKLCTFGATPFILSFIWIYYHGVIDNTHISTYLTILAVVGSVLTAMLAVVQAIIGFPMPEIEGVKLDPVDYPIYKKAMARLTTLRELYANIAFSVLLVVASMPVFLILKTIKSAPIAHGICSTIIYFVCTSVALTFIYVISGVYTTLDDHGDKLADKLKSIKPLD